MLKKVYLCAVIVLISCSLTIILIGCTTDVSSNNADISYSDDAEVGFRPVCPKCNHIGRTIIERISKGESSSGTEVCEKCDEVFEWSISR